MNGMWYVQLVGDIEIKVDFLVKVVYPASFKSPDITRNSIKKRGPIESLNRASTACLDRYI